jgi:branched-chain amino acid aminotransferase
MKIYLNGKYVTDHQAALEYNDRGFLLSDGIFETMRSYEGQIFGFEDHYERFNQSAHYLGIPLTPTFHEFKEIIDQLLKENELDKKDASFRVTLTRGTGPRGLIPPENVNPTLMMTAFPFESTIPKPARVMISSIRRNEFSPLSNIKSLCYLDNVIARRDANKKGLDDCIFLNTKGNVACATAANIFMVVDKGIVTPKIEEGILPGITRKMIINLCKSNNISIFEETITENELLRAKEIFFTNRLIEIQPVVQINSILINEGEVGEMVLWLQKFYQKLHVSL